MHAQQKSITNDIVEYAYEVADTRIYGPKWYFDMFTLHSTLHLGNAEILTTTVTAPSQHAARQAAEVKQRALHERGAGQRNSKETTGCGVRCVDTLHTIT